MSIWQVLMWGPKTVRWRRDRIASENMQTASKLSVICCTWRVASANRIYWLNRGQESSTCWSLTLLRRRRRRSYFGLAPCKRRVSWVVWDLPQWYRFTYFSYTCMLMIGEVVALNAHILLPKLFKSVLESVMPDYCGFCVYYYIPCVSLCRTANTRRCRRKSLAEAVAPASWACRCHRILLTTCLTVSTTCQVSAILLLLLTLRLTGILLVLVALNTENNGRIFS